MQLREIKKNRNILPHTSIQVILQETYLIISWDGWVIRNGISFQFIIVCMWL